MLPLAIVSALSAAVLLLHGAVVASDFERTVAVAAALVAAASLTGWLSDERPPAARRADLRRCVRVALGAFLALALGPMALMAAAVLVLPLLSVLYFLLPLVALWTLDHDADHGDARRVHAVGRRRSHALS
jgi:hypothetical protein